MKIVNEVVSCPLLSSPQINMPFKDNLRKMLQVNNNSCQSPYISSPTDGTTDLFFKVSNSVPNSQSQTSPPPYNNNLEAIGEHVESKSIGTNSEENITLTLSTNKVNNNNINADVLSKDDSFLGLEMV